MQHIRAFTIASVFVFITVSACQCGPASRCGSNNCEGCCTAMGESPAMTSDSACGSRGNLCSNCAMNNQTCNKMTNSCIGTSVGGGAGGGSTGGGAAAGGAAAGGTAGGSSGGGSAGGMSGYESCDIANPMCPPNTQCLIINVANPLAGQCVPGECDVLQQNCSNPATKCMVMSTSDGGIGRRCAPFTAMDGGLPDNASCTPAVPDPCQRGAQCIGFTGTAPVCRRYCGPLNACGAGSMCDSVVQFQTASGPTDERHAICTAYIPCDPLDQTPCGAAEACQFVNNVARCVMAGSQAAGQPCSNTMTCGRGTQCIVTMPMATMGTCQNLCNLDGGTPSCSAGSCVSLPGTTIGACSM